MPRSSPRYQGDDWPQLRHVGRKTPRRHQAQPIATGETAVAFDQCQAFALLGEAIQMNQKHQPQYDHIVTKC